MYISLELRDLYNSISQVLEKKACIPLTCLKIYNYIYHVHVCMYTYHSGQKEPWN